MKYFATLFLLVGSCLAFARAASVVNPQLDNSQEDLRIVSVRVSPVKESSSSSSTNTLSLHYMRGRHSGARLHRRRLDGGGDNKGTIIGSTVGAVAAIIAACVGVNWCKSSEPVEQNDGKVQET